MKIKDGFTLASFADKTVGVSFNEQFPNLMLQMNNSAAAAWRILEQDTDYDSLLRQLSDRYDVDNAVLRQDLDEFLDRLRAADLLEE